MILDFKKANQPKQIPVIRAASTSHLPHHYLHQYQTSKVGLANSRSSTAEVRLHESDEFWQIPSVLVVDAELEILSFVPANVSGIELEKSCSGRNQVACKIRRQN